MITFSILSLDYRKNIRKNEKVIISDIDNRFILTFEHY